MEGATTRSVCWKSWMVRAPQTPMAVRSAPIRFSVPSVRDVGPKRTRCRVVVTPTVTRVPRGSSAWGVAMPQWCPRAGGGAVDGGGDLGHAYAEHLARRAGRAGTDADQDGGHARLHELLTYAVA